MSNPVTTAQIGSAGLARYFGTPLFAVQWVGNDGTTTRTLQIFTDVTKTPTATVTPGKDNANETINMARSDRKRQLKFSAQCCADNQADALAIATDLPMPMDIISIGHLTAAYTASDFTTTSPIDTQIETPYAVLDSAEARWTPDNWLVVDITATIYLTPAGTIKAFAATS
jgi:hypothetical protein